MWRPCTCPLCCFRLNWTLLPLLVGLLDYELKEVNWRDPATDEGWCGGGGLIQCSVSTPRITFFIPLEKSDRYRGLPRASPISPTTGDRFIQSIESPTLHMSKTREGIERVIFRESCSSYMWSSPGFFLTNQVFAHLAMSLSPCLPAQKWNLLFCFVSWFVELIDWRPNLLSLSKPS